MLELLDIFQYEWAQRALIASTLVGIMCGALGCFIVLRNMALIGDALAHAILPGVVFAFMIVGYSVLGFFTGAVIAGLITAAGITWIQQQSSTKNDAAIGIVFTAMFSVGVMAISWISRNQGVHLDLKDFLFGNVLGVSDSDLILTTVVTVYVLLSIIVFYRYLFATTFQSVLAETMGISVKLIHYFLMLLLSFAVVASLRTVGVILVVAMLITPASTALLLTNRLKWVIALASLIGAVAAISGLVLAIIFETTPGPAMAVMATLIYLLAVIFAPEKGIITRRIRKNRLRRRIRQEDALKQAFKLHEADRIDKEELQIALQDLTQSQFKDALRHLRRKGYIDLEGENITMTGKGIEAAQKLVRAHRLWETYLVREIGLNEEQIHDDAERYEHLLTDDILNEVDQQLGHPTVDPHGSPIPAGRSTVDNSLWKASAGKAIRISNEQKEETVRSKLWEMGLLPGIKLYVLDHNEDHITVKKNGDVMQIEKDLAERINLSDDHSDSSPI